MLWLRVNQNTASMTQISRYGRALSKQPMKGNRIKDYVYYENHVTVKRDKIRNYVFNETMLIYKHTKTLWRLRRLLFFRKSSHLQIYKNKTLSVLARTTRYVLLIPNQFIKTLYKWIMSTKLSFVLASLTVLISMS